MFGCSGAGGRQQAWAEMMVLQRFCKVFRLGVSHVPSRANEAVFIRVWDVFFDHFRRIDIEIIKIISRRNQFVVHYEWEGSKHESGPTYHFSAIEIILLNKKRTLIEKVEGLWSEKQFRDQFK